MLHYEDFQQGQTFDLGSYYVSADEIVAFAREFDPQPFHLDEEAAKQSRNFMNELRTLGTAFNLLWQKISMGLLKVLSPFVKQFRERIMDNFQRIAKQLERAQTLEIIEKCLGDLPSRQREAFILRYWEEMDVAEAAKAMGCSEGSVKTHCSRATHTLAAALKKLGITL